MPTECTPTTMLFAPVERRRVEADFDGGAMTSDAGAPLLGASERAIGLFERFAACFVDARAPELIEHQVRTLVGQRVFGVALGYEDVSDHDQIGALVRISVRRIHLAMASGCPWQNEFRLAHLRLAAAAR